MIEGRLIAKLGFYERIIARMKGRNFVSDPCGHLRFRDIDVDDKEVSKIHDGLFDLSESLAVMIADGYEDVHNVQGDIHFIIADLQEYTGVK